MDHFACSDLFCGDAPGSELETQAYNNEAFRIQDVSNAYRLSQIYLRMCVSIFALRRALVVANIMCNPITMNLPHIQIFKEAS